MALIVGVIVALLGNYFLVEFFFQNRSRLGQEHARKVGELKVRDKIASEKDLWEQRSTWAREHQPRMEKEDRAGADLLEVVNQAASRHSVTTLSPLIEKPDKRPHCAAAIVRLETKSSWEALCAFLRDIQAPEQFMVFESAQIQVDAADKTQMHGVFRVAKWYAPK